MAHITTFYLLLYCLFDISSFELPNSLLFLFIEFQYLKNSPMFACNIQIMILTQFQSVYWFPYVSP